ncbi:hypothetical protein RHGRI_035296 [Rhododendron griersonianum]|uniref:Sulfite exporter TauE/SafE family protein n=1 Tax=Rhododendron griersonianum TaxID=479676 RepID=A0AAV6I4U5_9ERIC|nr:hypothetical protein RHGRI_035296 [Rhododendron griersonianum]
MGEIGLRGKLLSSAVVAVLGLSSVLFVSNQWSTLKLVFSSSEGRNGGDVESNHITKLLNLVWREARLGYEHVWPEMEFGWKIVVGTVIGFFGAAFGSVGGVGGGGIFVPMLTLIIGFDAKSSTAMSKCMITGASAAAVCYNIKLRHPTLELPIIDYDLALLFQPMLVLGISIGVTLNVIFADWMVTVLLIILFLGVDSEEVEYKPLPEGPNNGTQMESSESKASTVSIIENVHWKELGILVAVWVFILALQIAKGETTTCSAAYWVLNLLQIPVAFGASAYEAIGLYKGRRIIASKGDVRMTWRIHQLVLYCFVGILAGVVGGLLGLGGGFILGYARFWVPMLPGLRSTCGEKNNRDSREGVFDHLHSGLHNLCGVGISNIIKDIEEKEYMGFEDICSY